MKKLIVDMMAFFILLTSASCIPIYGKGSIPPAGYPKFRAAAPGLLVVTLKPVFLALTIVATPIGMVIGEVAMLMIYFVAFSFE